MLQLPSDFIERTRPLLKDQWNAFVAALSEEAPVSIRLNKRKNKSKEHHLTNQVLWCQDGYYLDKRPQFTFDPLFHAGAYYVQEASSMFVAHALKQYVDGRVNVLDLCAAPGGKSTLIVDSISDDSLLVANEVIKSRSYILSENITKWGNPNVVVTNSDPADIGKLNHFFDVMLVDAPCSGEGMFRKDGGAIGEWSVDNVKLCKERQQRILADVWSALKPGGLLLYSTCTYNKEENEDNVQWIANELGAKVLPIDIPAEWKIGDSYVEGLPSHHFFPHTTCGEGFFFALLQKNEAEIGSVTMKPKKDKGGKKKIDLSLDFKEYLVDSDSFDFYQQGDFWFAIPSIFTNDLQLLKSKLNIVSAGVCIGEMKGKDLIPNQSLALSNFLNRDVFELHEVDWKTAISYLRKETLVLSNLPKGYILLTYKGQALGFVKNIGNRANNIYPQEWRIRSNHSPESEVSVV